MKAAFLFEFASLKSTIAQMFALFVVVGALVGIGMQSAVGASACMAAMAPIMFAMIYSSYDTTTGWERFRATLPVSRAALVAGRYANILVASVIMVVIAAVFGFLLAWVGPMLPVGAEAAASFAGELAEPIALVAAPCAGMCVVIVMVALVLPLFLRFGMTKAMRIVPVGIAVVFLAVMAAMPSLPVQGVLDTIDLWFTTPEGGALVMVVVVVGALALYAISCAVAIALYRSKEL